MNNIFFKDTPIGKIGIEENEYGITNLYINNVDIPRSNIIFKESNVINKAFNELEEYFNGCRKVFTVPLSPQGSNFMKTVWNALIDIPYGETSTYGYIAEIIGNPKGARAVGAANNKNPIPIFIPCHRVIGKNGDLTGYSQGLELKKYLLKLEKLNKK